MSATAPPLRHDKVPLPLLGAGAMVLASLLAAGGSRLMHLSTVQIPDAATVASVHLQFSDSPDGSIRVEDVSDGHVIAIVPPGQQNFLRSTVRGLARERKRESQGPEIPFELRQQADGRITLLDPATNRRIDLESFGPTNAATFAALLPAPTRSPR
jgi:putative photosynthetic complex assembly protein